MGVCLASRCFMWFVMSAISRFVRAADVYCFAR